MNHKRIIEMDMARSIAILAVVLIHVSAFALINSEFGTINSRLFLCLNQISRFSVPLFVFISGMGIALGYKREKGYLYFLNKRVRKVLPSYIIWGILYIVIINENYNVSTWANLLLNGDRIYYHLYFIPMIIILYILFPIFYPKIIKPFWVFFIFFITCLIIGTSHYFNIPDVKLDFFSKKNSIFWSGYFVLGVFISRSMDKFLKVSKKHDKKITLLLILSGLLLIIESFLNVKWGKSLDYATTFIRPSVIFYSICVIMYIFSKNYNDDKFGINILHSISKKSFSIYLIHPFILHYYMKIFNYFNLKIGSIYFLVTAFIICVIFPMVISKEQ